MANIMLGGTYRFVHRDSNDNTIAELLEKHKSEFLGVLGAPETDPQKMPKVKKQLSTILKEDDKLVLMYKHEGATATIVTGTSGVRTMRIPVTFRNRRSGVRYEKTLVIGDFVNTKDITTVGEKWVAGQWYDMETYIIPAQSELKIGHAIQDVRVDSAINVQHDVQTS